MAQVSRLEMARVADASRVCGRSQNTHAAA